MPVRGARLGRGVPRPVETDDPEAFAGDVRAAVLEATRLHCSVGIGDNKLQAKIATDFGKPRGVGRLDHRDLVRR